MAHNYELLFDIFRTNNHIKSITHFLSQVTSWKPIMQIAKHFRYWASWYDYNASSALIRYRSPALFSVLIPQESGTSPNKISVLVTTERSPAKWTVYQPSSSSEFSSILSPLFRFPIFLQLISLHLPQWSSTQQLTFLLSDCNANTLLRMVFLKGYTHCDDSSMLNAQCQDRTLKSFYVL